MKKLLFSVLLLAFAYANDNSTVKDISFSGNKSFFSTTLKEAAGIDGDFFYKFWKKQPSYSREEIENIRQELIEFYNSKGFFKAQIETRFAKDEAIFEIEEHERVRISKVEINSPFYIKNMIALSSGDYFDADAFVKSKENIKKYLGEHGMPKAKLSSKAYIDMEKYEARLEFNITEASRSKFGKITINELPNIERDVLLDRLAFREDEPYDVRKIDESYKNLYATGVFETVSIKPILEKDGDDVPVDLNLTTGKTRSFRVGAGYDTDEGPRIKGGWLNKNFFGNLKRFEAIVELSNIRQTVGAKISVPKLLGYDFEDLAKFEKLKYPGFTEQIGSNTFKFKIPHKTTTNHIGVLTEIGSVRADEASEKIENKSFIINALLYEYTIERRDSVLDPKHGYFIGWNLEFADNVLGSSINYIKSNIETKTVLSFDDASALRDFLFSARANIGTIDDFKKNDIPVFKRYFAGGSFSNRGYQYRRLGNKDSHGNYVGGNSIVDYSIEARYKTTKSLWGVLFFDSTLLSQSSLVFNGEYKHSVGTGVRYDTVVGPIRFDVGFALNEQKRSPVFHISFGQAF